MLANSAFASLNLFPPAPTHLPRSSSTTYDLPKLRRSRASSRVSIPPTIPARQSSISSHEANQSPDLSYYLDRPITSTPPIYEVPLPVTPPTTYVVPLDSPSSIRSRITARSSSMSAQRYNVVDLGSPCVISGEHDGEARPGTVHVGKEQVVNWARPFQGDGVDSQVQIFGQSAQRARRMKKSFSTVDLSSPTPSSSDDEPLPLTPDMNRSWTIGTELTGLGVKAIKDFDSFHTERISLDEIHLDSPTSLSAVELASPVLFSITAPPSTPRWHPTPARLLNSSQSLNSLAAPANLAELRQLQQAAVDLQHEARRPLKLSLPKERRIRRKAVPSVPEEDVSWGQASGSSKSYTLEVAPVQISRSTSGSSAQSSGGSVSNVDISESVGIVFAEPITPPRRENPVRRFYGNAKATMSIIDVSPRTASLPIFVPPRSASKMAGHQRSTSAPQASPAVSLDYHKSSSDSSSDSGESWDQPVTPSSFNSGTKVGGNGFLFAPSPPAKAKKSIYGNKSAFLSQLDLGLKRVLDRKEGEEDKKHRRGLSRFLGKR